MKLKDFYYDLPKELIAQAPLDKRDSSRLLVLDRKDKTITEKKFTDIVDYFTEGDCLVLNNTRVLPVRLYGKRKTGGKVEIFLLNPKDSKLQALIKPSKRIKEGEDIELENGRIVKVLGPADVGRFVEFDGKIEDVLENGHIPLPPYIKREDSKEDRDSYQTVYAEVDGATASPTAGLHFTQELLERLRGKGIKIVYVTLHTSYGTFSPVSAEDIEDHVMHSEYYEISAASAEIINDVKSSGKKVFAVGTTSTRVLESTVGEDGKVCASSGKSDLFIYPGYKFKVIDSLITNFHLPESTLVMLVSTLAGKDFLFEGYRKAIDKKFRFFSYGDAMLII